MSIRKAIAGVVGLGIAFGALPSTTAAEPSREAPPATSAATAAPALNLQFQYSGGKAGRDAIAEAIEAVTDEMNFFVRGIARRRLLAANGIIPTLHFSLDGDPIAATYIDGRVIEAPRDGRSIPWVDHQGETIEVSHRYADRRLVQTMTGDQGTRRNVYRFSEDGSSLTMSVEIQSSKLPSPVRYVVEYRRTS